MSEQIAKKDLAQLDVEALLNIQVQEVEHIKDYVPLPTARYDFTVKNVGIEEVGNDKTKAIVVEMDVTGCDTETLEKPEDSDDLPNFEEEAFSTKSMFFLESTKPGVEDNRGIRDFLTLGAAIEGGEELTAAQLIEQLPGMQGQGQWRRRSFRDAADNQRTVSNLATHTVEFN